MFLKQQKIKVSNRLTCALYRLTCALYRLTCALAPQRYGCYNNKNEVAKNAKRYSKRISNIAQKNIGCLFCQPIFLLECKKQQLKKRIFFFFNRKKK